LGPWLAEVRDELRQTIMSDLTPRPALPREAYAEAVRTITDARTAADDILARATEQAAKIRDTAERDLIDMRQRTKAALQYAASRL
jgi:F0F1-type ATP synthase membrane subunit b/b'